ncbi:hypothetical protein T12_8897, partial [Trichinella patagoniensis]
LQMISFFDFSLALADITAPVVLSVGRSLYISGSEDQMLATTIMPTGSGLYF